LYAFRAFDHDCDGSISPHDFRKVMHSLDLNLSFQEIDFVMKDACLNEDGNISF
jgi:Ca2+-binding EF-hand superfamily protein